MQIALTRSRCGVPPPFNCERGCLRKSPQTAPEPPDGKSAASPMQDTALSQASSPDAITGAAAKADYVIDLAAIRVSSGILWDRMQDGIAARLKSALSRVAPSATFRQAGPDMTRCVVSMPPPDERAAKACTLAAYELVAGLMGRCEFSNLHISRTLIDPVRGPCQERLTIEEITHYLDQSKAPPSTETSPLTKRRIFSSSGIFSS